MNAKILIGCVAGLAFGGTALAADAPAAPKPGAEHKKLGYFVGKWKTEGDMKDSPMGPGGKMTSDDTCDWFKGGFAIVCRGVGNGPTGPMKSLGIISYSADEKVYTYYGTDNSGMAMTTVPKGTVEGDTWTYNDESKMGGKMVKSRYSMKIVSPTSYTFKYEMQGDDGKWNSMMEGTATRVGGSEKKN